ncbi:MAG TPA: hypothetical protein VFQ91_12785 [Bryobacteraceae bacterium]|nr:hypothetical protein [Bryobacteraceae bacterium]
MSKPPHQLMKNMTAAVLAVGLLPLAGCQGTLSANEEGVQGVCNIIREFGETEGAPRSGGGFVCRAAPGPILITAHSSPRDPNSLDEVLIEGRYPRREESSEIKAQMVTTSNAIFKKLNMAVPPGIAVAIQNRSRGEAMSGRLLVTVDHTCVEATAGNGDPCRIVVWIRKGALR